MVYMNHPKAYLISTLFNLIFGIVLSFTIFCFYMVIILSYDFSNEWYNDVIFIFYIISFLFVFCLLNVFFNIKLFRHNKQMDRIESSKKYIIATVCALFLPLVLLIFYLAALFNGVIT